MIYLGANWKGEMTKRTPAVSAESQIKQLEKLLAEQNKANADSSARRAKFATTLRAVYEAFEQKPAQTEIRGFKTFDALVTHLSANFGMHRRQIYKHLTVSRALAGKLAEKDLEDVGIEKAYVLARLERAKPGALERPGFVEAAKAMSTDELEAKSDAIIAGKDELLQTGKWEHLSIQGPREYISDLRGALELARRQLGAGPSDAEVLCCLTANAVQELQHEEGMARQAIAGEQ